MQRHSLGWHGCSLPAAMASTAQETRKDWLEFTQDVTLHGVRYVYHKDINVIRR